MNAPEGIRRIATAIRWIGDGFGGLFVLVGFVIVGAAFFNPGGVDAGLGIFALIIGGLMIGGGRLLSWIINGFAESKSPGG